MKVFITGGTGCVGQYVTKALIERGDEVTLLTRSPERVSVLNGYPGVTLLKGSLADLDVLSEGVKGQDAVIHMALSMDMSPYRMLQKDTEPLAWLLEQADKAGVNQFIATSTVAAFMRAEGPMVSEKDYPAPMTAYAGCKAAAEMIALGYNLNAEMKPVTMKRNIIRPTNCYAVPAFSGGAGPADSRFRALVKGCLLGQELFFKQNEGEQFISARQLSSVFLRVLDSEENEQVFFGAGSRYVTWKEIAERILRLIPESTAKLTVTDEPPLRKPCVYDTSKIRDHFSLSFDGLEDLDEYLIWEIDRARREISGEVLEDVSHM